MNRFLLALVAGRSICQVVPSTTALAMPVFSLVMGRMEVAPEHDPLFLRSVNMLFLIIILLSFLGIFAFLARRKTMENVSLP